MYEQSEHKVIFGIHPGTETDRLPFLKHRNLSTLRSGLEPRMDLRSELPAKFGVCRSKLGVPGHIHPEIKVRWLFFFDCRGGVFIFI